MARDPLSVPQTLGGRLGSSTRDRSRRYAATAAWSADPMRTRMLDHLRTARLAAMRLERAARRVGLEVEALAARRRRSADLAIFHELVPPPSGGGDRFLAALASGLPALAVRGGAHSEPVGGGGCLNDDAGEVPDLLDLLAGALEERRDAIVIPALADVADAYLQALELDA